MKKLFLAVAAVAMVFATSCKKESVNGAVEPAADNEFICVIDQNASQQNAPAVSDDMGTLAHIDKSNNVWWQEGDQIAYYGTENTDGVGRYELTCSKLSDNSAYFSAEGKHFGQGAHEAYYPASIMTLNGTQKVLTLPSTITLEANKNAAQLPMYGTGNGTHYLTFHNICAVFKITIPATVTDCDRIVLHADEDLCGTFSLSGTGDQSNPYKAVVNNSGAAGYNTITIDGDFDGSNDAKKTVYVAIPAKSGSETTPAYSNVYFELFANDGTNYNSILKTAKQNLTRNIVVNTVYHINSLTPASTVLLPGHFCIDSNKYVQFTQGNLYWDGSGWQIEATQDAYPTTWNTDHIGHFYYAEDAADAYGTTAPTYSTYPKHLFCDSVKRSISVSGETGLRVLNFIEWSNLISGKNGSSVHKGTNYLLVSPVNYSGPALSTITTVADATAAGVLYLPMAGVRKGTTIKDYSGKDMCGMYMTADYIYGLKEDQGFKDGPACLAFFDDEYPQCVPTGEPNSAFSIRLVKDVPTNP